MPRSTVSRLSRTTVVWIALISLAFTACGDDDKDSGSNPPTQTEHVVLPLKIGNIWSFDRQIIEGFAPPDAYSLELTSTRDIAGATYFTLLDVKDDSPSASYIRQSGRKLWLIPQEFLDGEVEKGDTATEWIQEEAASSFPWKYADTDAVVDVPWTIFEASDRITLQGFEVDISITVVGRHLGAGETTTPAGTFTTARTRIDQRVVLDAPLGTVTIDNSTELEIADQVGFVRILETATSGSSIQTEESTLTSYTLPE